MSDELIHELPADLRSVLRDPSVIVPQDAAVFELIALWAKAPTTTASASIAPQASASVVSTFYGAAEIKSSTTPAGCY